MAPDLLDDHTMQSHNRRHHSVDVSRAQSRSDRRGDNERCEVQPALSYFSVADIRELMRVDIRDEAKPSSLSSAWSPALHADWSRREINRLPSSAIDVRQRHCIEGGRWLFDFMDFCILALFIGWGLVEAHRQLKG
jgi:hypothetical protein